MFETRRIDDAYGDVATGTWTVREIDTAGQPGVHRTRCLIFENRRVVRRVWSFPADWATLPAEALLRLVDDAR